mgnify:CR=1 FL=1
MVKYTIKRLLQSVVTVSLIVAIVFLLLHTLPTDYYFTEDQLMKFSDEQKHDLLEAAGLLAPPVKQLFRYYGQVLHGDFGTSRRIQAGISVTKVIGDKFAISMRMGVTALLISLGIGTALGILQTRFKDKLADHIGTAYTVFVNAVPPLVSYSLILVFGSHILKLPSMYSTRNPGPSSIMPITCLAIASIASYALWTRRYMVDELNKDYIKLAKVKGMSSKNIMVKHVLRNAFVPLAQYLPYSFLLTIGGSILVERFFSVPGLGPLLTDAINRYDINVVMALVIMYASLSILGVFLGDVLMMIIDPRITLTGKGGTR